MAEPISYETVTETWQRMAETPPEQAQTIIDQMEQEQPVVMVFLLALDDFPFNQTEREIIFYIGAVLWEIMKQSPIPLQMVSEEAIAKAEENNYQFLELLSNDTEADFMSATRTLIDNYGEPEVLRYLVEALMEDGVDLDEYEGEYVEEDEGGLLMDLTTEELEALFDDTPNQTISDVNGEFLQEFEVIEGDDEDLEDDEDEEWQEFNIRPEYRGVAFVHLKTVLDAFIESRS